MTLLEIEQRRSRRAHRKHRKEKRKKKRPSALDAPLAMSDDSQCLTFFEWCQLNRFSERTGRRILKSGNGPIITQLSGRPNRRDDSQQSAMARVAGAGVSAPLESEKARNR